KLADTAPQIQHMHPGRNPRAPQKLFGQRVQDGSLQGKTPPLAIVVSHDIVRLRRLGSADGFPWRDGGLALEDIWPCGYCIHDTLQSGKTACLETSGPHLADGRKGLSFRVAPALLALLGRIASNLNSCSCASRQILTGSSNI